ncbi:hypothetical protein LINPERHAP1_LOCUS28623 [Linum perenne]
MLTCLINRVVILWKTFLRARRFKRGSIRSTNEVEIALLDQKCTGALFEGVRRTFRIKLRQNFQHKGKVRLLKGSAPAHFW